MTINRKLPDTSLEPSGEFAESIRSFRSAMHHVGDQTAQQDALSVWLAPARKRQKSAQRRMVMAWAAALGLLFGGALPLTLHLSHETPTYQQAKDLGQPKDNASDTALLEQVDSAVSESVPDSLAPLAELDNWSSDSKTENRQ
jgi:4-amino-4-deoxy-L-arabinose transferase-like glycosyltransferase